MILSAQSIKERCKVTDFREKDWNPMIDPFIPHKCVVKGKSFGLSACTYDCRIMSTITLKPGETTLANTIENFHMPYDVCATVVDKSSFARVFVSMFNTLIDPGFIGNLTLEVANLGDRTVTIEEGSPVCQILFHKLDEPTDRPYKGKYQYQTQMPHPARYEEDSNE